MHSIAVLTYHSVADDPATGIARFSVGRGQFDDHLRVLDDLGVTTITAGALANLVSSATTLPERCAVITFDDGYRDNLNAFERLAASGRSATLFVTTGQLEGVSERHPVIAPMLRPADLTSLPALGVELGAHGHDHLALDVEPTAPAARDIARARSLLGEWTGAPPELFAYPYGFHRAHTRALVRSAGYRAAYGVGNRSATSADDCFGISRFLVERSTTTARLVEWIEGRGPRSDGRERPATTGYRAVRWVRRRLGGSA